MQRFLLFSFPSFDLCLSVFFFSHSLSLSLSLSPFPLRAYIYLHLVFLTFRQEAQKFSRHAKRTYLTPEDVNLALKLRNVQPIYGLSSSMDPSRFVRAAGFEDVFYLKDPVLSIETALEEIPQMSAPWEAGLRIHWLAIDGVQPVIPENAPLLAKWQHVKRRRTEYEPPQGVQGTGVLPVVTSAGTRTRGVSTVDAGGGQRGAAESGQLELPSQLHLGTGGLEGGALVRAPLKHILSRELQLYYDKVAHVLKNPFPASDSGVDQQGLGPRAATTDISLSCRAILASLRVDAGVQPLVPYLCQLLSKEIADSITDAPKLLVLLRASKALCLNFHLDVGQYLHLIMPALLTCLLGRQIGSSGRSSAKKSSMASSTGGDLVLDPEAPHWQVREFAADAVASVCASYPEIAARVQRQILSSMTSPGASLQTIFGAVVGIYAQGPRAVKTLLLPNLIPCIQSLREDLEGRRGAARFGAALKVRSALLAAAGHCVFMSGICDLPVMKLGSEATGGLAGTKKKGKRKQGAAHAPSIFERVKKKLANVRPSGVSSSDASIATVHKVSSKGKSRPNGEDACGRSSGTDAVGAVARAKELFYWDSDVDESTAREEIEKAAESIEIIPAGVMHPTNTSNETWQQQSQPLLRGSILADLPEINILEQAWKDDFPVEVLQEAVCNAFGEDIAPYERELQGSGSAGNPYATFV